MSSEPDPELTARHPELDSGSSGWLFNWIPGQARNNDIGVILNLTQTISPPARHPELDSGSSGWLFNWIPGQARNDDIGVILNLIQDPVRYNQIHEGVFCLHTG